MRYIFLLISLQVLLFGLSEQKIKKELSSQTRAEVFLQNKIEGGYYQDAEVFFQNAQKKYSKDSELLRWGGELYLQTNNLDKAKRYFVESLALDPSNEICSTKIQQIEAQKKAQENKDVGKLLDILWDKGLDFLMIFLAFLGGEIIGKRYHSCQHDTVNQIAEYYLHRKMLASNTAYRLKFLASQYLSQKFFSFCFILNFLVITVITITLLITWLFIEFTYDINWFLESPLLTLNADEIAQHIYIFFTLFFVLSLIGRAIIGYLQLPREEKLYELIFVENLDRLMNETAYVKLYEIFLFVFNKSPDTSNKKEIEALLDNYSQSNTEDFKKFIQ